MTAAPQNTIPTPITTDVTMAGVSLKWRNVKRTMPKILIYEQFHPLLRLIKPMRNNGIDKKNPAMAHVLVMDAFFRYLVVLNKNVFLLLIHWHTYCRVLKKISRYVKVDKCLWNKTTLTDLLTYLILPWLDLTSLAANKNWMAQTRRQERFSERVKAIMATVTFKW